jgi:hypothetical protein
MFRASLLVIGMLLGGVAVSCDSSGGGNGGSSDQALIAFSRTGDMYVVDSTDASTNLFLNTFFDDGGAVDVGPVSGSIYNPVTEKIWMGLGGNNSPCSSCILALDLGTGEGEFVADGSDAGQNGFPGIAISNDNRIFVPEGDSNGLFEINNTTGASTQVSSTTDGTSGGGMTYSSDGALYLAADERVYEVNQTNFDASEVAALTKTGFPTDAFGQIISMTTRESDGVIFGIWRDGAGTGAVGPAYLVTLTPTSGVMTYRGTMDSRYDGLAFVPSGSLPE